MKIAVAPVALLLGVLQPVAGDSLAQTKTQIEDDSYLYIHREPTVWPSPESVLRDLRSSSDDVRLKALKLAGLTDKQSHRAVWVSVNGGPAKVIGDAVIVPDRVQLARIPPKPQLWLLRCAPYRLPMPP